MGKKYKAVKKFDQKKFYGAAIRMIIAVLFSVFLIYYGLNSGTSIPDSGMPKWLMLTLMFLMAIPMIYTMEFLLVKGFSIIFSKIEGTFLRIVIVIVFLCCLGYVAKFFSYMMSSFSVLSLIIMILVVVYDFFGSFYYIETYQETGNSSMPRKDPVQKSSESDAFLSQLVSKSNQDDTDHIGDSE